MLSLLSPISLFISQILHTVQLIISIFLVVFSYKYGKLHRLKSRVINSSFPFPVLVMKVELIRARMERICRRAANDAVEYSGEVGDPSKETRECSMCGDVGFVFELVFCKRCISRYQHTYCSKLYPDVDMETWACDWCLYEEENKKITLGKRKAAENNNSNRNKALEFLLQIAQDEPGSQQSQKKSEAESSVCQIKEVDAYPSPKLPDVNKNEIPPKSPQKQPRLGSGRSVNDGWRRVAKSSKLHWNTASSRVRVIGRRYKLLADVLC